MTAPASGPFAVHCPSCLGVAFLLKEPVALDQQMGPEQFANPDGTPIDGDGDCVCGVCGRGLTWEDWGKITHEMRLAGALT